VNRQLKQGKHWIISGGVDYTVDNNMAIYCIMVSSIIQYEKSYIILIQYKVSY
jgi:hypothetical protein